MHLVIRLLLNDRKNPNQNMSTSYTYVWNIKSVVKRFYFGPIHARSDQKNPAILVKSLGK